MCREFDRAELEADISTLQKLLDDDFLSIGPKGFILNKEEWINRHVHFKYQKLEVSDIDIRLYDNTAIVLNIRRNEMPGDYYNYQLNSSRKGANAQPRIFPSCIRPFARIY